MIGVITREAITRSLLRRKTPADALGSRLPQSIKGRAMNRGKKGDGIVESRRRCRLSVEVQAGYRMFRFRFQRSCRDGSTVVSMQMADGPMAIQRAACGARSSDTACVSRSIEITREHRLRTSRSVSASRISAVGGNSRRCICKLLRRYHTSIWTSDFDCFILPHDSRRQKLSGYHQGDLGDLF